MCDFGVSGQLIDSMANSFVGTRSYMSVSYCTLLSSQNKEIVFINNTLSVHWQSHFQSIGHIWQAYHVTFLCFQIS